MEGEQRKEERRGFRGLCGVDTSPGDTIKVWRQNAGSLWHPVWPLHPFPSLSLSLFICISLSPSFHHLLFLDLPLLYSFSLVLFSLHPSLLSFLLPSASLPLSLSLSPPTLSR